MIKKINVLAKSDIQLLDDKIKQEEFEKQKELFSLQGKLNSKIIENSKIMSIKKPDIIVTQHF